MITGKMKYKLKPLTLDQKVMRQCVDKVSKSIRDRVRAEVKKDSGALRMSVSTKLLKKRGFTGAVVGVRSKFSKTYKKRRGEKIPNKYAIRQGCKQVIAKYINQNTLAQIKVGAKQMLDDMLSKGEVSP